MDINQISELVKLFSDYGLKRLDISEGDLKLVLEAHDTVCQPRSEAGFSILEAQPAPKPAAPAKSAEKPEEGAFIETSPVVGTVYVAATPGGKPLVNVGDTVTMGQPLCVVEAMKMFTNLTAHASGVIKEKYFEDGQAVGIGQQLFKIAADRG